MKKAYQPKTGTPCTCKPGKHRDNCPLCEGTGMRIDFAAIRARKTTPKPATPTPRSTLYRFTPQTIAATDKLGLNQPDEQAQKRGMMEGEPLTVCMDALLKYAECYRVRFEQPLAEDGVLGDHWLDCIKNLRGLMNGDGANAMRSGITTDSKCNGALETVFWAAMATAGFSDTSI